MSVVAEALPIPQGRIFELVRRLSEPVLDLGGVTEIIDSEPLLNSRILGFLNTSPFEGYRNPLRISDAVVLLGSERLRILVLGCALAEFAGRRLPEKTMFSFWRHSILTGILSEKIAREVHPESVEKAYLAGLLHDIGSLPLLIAAHEEEAQGVQGARYVFDQPSLEHSYFGVDHCEIGRWIGLSGNFAPWMVDVLEHHHDHSQSFDHSILVAAVAAADRCNSHFDESGVEKQAGDWPPLHGDLLSQMRPRHLLQANQAARSRFLQNCTLQTPFPLFGSC